MKFSVKIDLLMKQKQIKNLRTLAQKSKIPYTTLWDYYAKEERFETAKLSTIKALANYLGCSIDYLAYEEVEDSTSKLDQEISLAKLHYNKKVLEENDYTVELCLPKPWEKLTKKEKEHITEEAMDTFYELKRETKKS